MENFAYVLPRLSVTSPVMFSPDFHRSTGFTLVDSLRPTNLVSLRMGKKGSSSSSLRLFLSPMRCALRLPTISAEEVKDVPMPKIDKRGRLRSPRDARELVLVILYAACLEGSDALLLFEKGINKRGPDEYEFDINSLLEYNSFGGPPVKTETREEEDELARRDENESKIKAEVLSAPPKLVYSEDDLSFAKTFLDLAVKTWDTQVDILEPIAPPDWTSAPAGRILEFTILQLAMTFMACLGIRRHPKIINWAADLANWFCCDGSAPIKIYGCLRTMASIWPEEARSKKQEARSVRFNNYLFSIGIILLLIYLVTNKLVINEFFLVKLYFDGG